MDDGRYYPTVTTLGDGEGYGKVLAMSGLRTEISGCSQQVNRDPEIYDPRTGWSKMRDPQQAVQPFDDLYTGAHVIPYGPFAGKIFYSMPMTQAWVFNPFFSGPYPNGGYWTPVGKVRTQYRGHGNSVLLPLLPGSTSAKVLIIGGGGPATNTALVVGGNTVHPVEGPVFTAESYDVQTGMWSLLPAMNRRRMYHSVGILLPDGRVWVSGTEFGGVVERNIELYYPGYLFEGDRPEFVQPPPDVINYGTQFGIVTNMSIAAIRLIRFSATTHATDMDQRSVGLSFSTGPALNHAIPYEVTAPSNANIAPPGLYMLFVLRPKSASISGQTMIPSVAKIVKLERAP